jgi:ribose transport system ATP-binding protein
MVGHDVRTEQLTRTVRIGEEVLRVENLSHRTFFRNVSFSVRSGEILGFTGLLGDGRSELFQALFGAQDIQSGMVWLDGREVRIQSTEHALELGIGYLPRNRKENAIIKDMDIMENASIVTWPLFARNGVIDKNRHAGLFAEQRERLGIRLQRVTDPINTLSGGNQQKVVLAKWLAARPKVLILDNPTQGVDVGAKEEIYDIILNLAEQGLAIIVLSSEAQEVIRLCDRALVMYQGHIQGEVSGSTMNEHDIMRLATGGALDAS